MQNTAGIDQALAARGFPPHVVDPLTPSLSERASQHLRGRKPLRGGSWRSTHVIEASIRDKFDLVAFLVETANLALNGNSYKLNVMLTLNIEQFIRQGETPQRALRRFLQYLRNLFRSLPHRFSGFWRLEIGSSRYGGWHYHIVFHAPRGMRATLIEALPIWTDETLDVSRSSQSFNKTQWRLYGSERGWQLERIYDVPGLIDYLAKAPLGRDGKPLTRSLRLGKAKGRVREYGLFGVSKHRQP